MCVCVVCEWSGVCVYVVSQGNHEGTERSISGRRVGYQRPQTSLCRRCRVWTEPTFIVTSVFPTNVSVRDLTCNQGGKNTSSLQPSVKNDVIVNRKMTSLYPVPSSFFVRAKVKKKFGGRWCSGTVDWVDTDEGETLWHVTYDEFDEEQMTRAELT